MEENKTEEEKGFKVVQVPASYTLAIETPKGEVVSMEGAILYLLNETERIKKTGGF